MLHASVNRLKSMPRRASLIAVVVMFAAAIVLGATQLPRGRAIVSDILGDAGSGVESESARNEAPNDDHERDHAGHNESNSIEVSESAQKNIGLEVIEIKLQPFERSISVPGLVIEQPGRSTVHVSAPMTGVITRVYPTLGEAVEPDAPLFEMRLTHEELVQAQADLLRTAQELEVINREVDRLAKVSSNGAVAGKTYLERKYEQEKQQAVSSSQKQAMLLHGLSSEQVEAILSKGQLLQNLTVRAPGLHEGQDAGESYRLLQVDSLDVTQGQHVESGETLCVLTDHARLYIEGRAFEHDVPALNKVAAEEQQVSAIIESQSSENEVLEGLAIRSLSSQVDQESRTFQFYVDLPNDLLREAKTEDGHRYIYWRFKPGQRMQVRVPVESWKDRIVIPATAVARDGPETYVFQPNGEHFDRISVHVEYQDQLWAVVANDGSLYPGDRVASKGAHQLQLAIKNKSGGAMDPHAGHNH